MAIIIEIIGRNRKPLETVTVKGDSVTLGRAYDNQVILHDPYVSPAHAAVEIAENGKLFIRDLGSENGIRNRANKSLETINEIKSGDEFILGKTRIRVLLSDHQVAPALRLGKMDIFLHRVGHPAMVAMLALLLGTVVIFKAYLQSYSAFQFIEQFNNVIALLLLCMMWALFWLLVARISKHDGHFLQQLAITLMILILAAGITSVMNWVNFNIPGNKTSVITEYLQWFLVVFLLFWFNLYVALFQSSKMRLFIAGSLGGLAVAVLLVTDLFGRQDFRSRPEYSATMLPPGFLVAQPVDEKAFIKKSGEVFKRLPDASGKK